MFDSFDSPASHPQLALSFFDYLTSDDGKHRLTVTDCPPFEDWRAFIPEGFETISQLCKSYGCGMSLATVRAVLERGKVPMQELFILTPPNEHVMNAASHPATPDHEYKLLTSDKDKLTFDRADRCVYLNGSRFAGLNPYVVTVFDELAAFEFLKCTFMPQVREVRPYVFKHPRFEGAQRDGLKLDPAKVFKAFRVDLVQRHA